MLWKLHNAQPGDGARLRPLWEPWLGLRHGTAMDVLDAGAMVDSYERLELVLWAQNRQTGEVAGMLLASPSTSLMQEFPDAANEIAQLVVKLRGVAVAPDERGQGLGRILVRRAIAEYRACDYAWMYGQFDADQPRLADFYRRLGYTVHPQGEDLMVPSRLNIPSTIVAQPAEHWFDQRL